MKAMKKVVGILLTVAMIFLMAVPAFALTEVPANSGSILVTNNDTIDASQKTFAAYKILDARVFVNDDGEPEAFTYSVPAEMVEFYEARYGLVSSDPDFANKVFDAISAESDLYAFAADVLAANPVAPYAGEAVEGVGYQFSDLPIGYYIVADTTAEGDYIKPVSALMVDTTTPGLEIVVKTEKPHIGKEIDKDNDLTTEDDRVDANEAAIGDVVTYVIDTKVPDMEGYDKYFFIVNDRLSAGLTYNEDLVVTLGGETLVEGEDYVLTTVEKEDGTTELRVVFSDFIQYNTPEFTEAPIVLTYTATLNEDAVIYTDSNTNDVYLEYSDDPQVNYGGENEPNEDDEENLPPLGITGTVSTDTYTTSIEIVKTDDMSERLTGAEFTITGESMNIVRVEKDVFTEDENGEYWKLTDGSYTTTDPNGTINGVAVDKEKYESETVKYSKETVVEFVRTEGETKTVTAEVAQDGTVRFEGLGEGTYTIKEIKAPAGYNALEEELTVTVTWNEETESFEYTGAIDEDGVARLVVVNVVGTELPSTGGIGTKIFYTLGGIMVLAAVVLLVSKKRMGAKN